MNNKNQFVKFMQLLQLKPCSVHVDVRDWEISCGNLLVQYIHSDE